MEESKPSRIRGLGFVIVCIVVIGAGLYQNAKFDDRIAELREEFNEQFKALSQETVGVKPQIQVNLDTLRRIEDALVSLESRVKSVSGLGTQMHDMLFQQAGVQDERDATLNTLIETGQELQRQVEVLLSQAGLRHEQGPE
jgi:archaellum component FlaC